MSYQGPSNPWGTPPPDVWGHEVGEDAGHRLDATGHMPHQTDPVARMIGEPHVVTKAEIARTRMLWAVAIVVLLAVIAAAVLWVVSQT